MGRPVKSSSSRGLLLVEAVLAAVVIATGLVFISRGLSGQLTALRTIEEHDVLRSLANGKLLELEGERLARAAPSTRMDGVFPDPYADYRWALSATPRQGQADLKDQDGLPLTSDIALTVTRQRARSSSVTLRAIWPAAWVPQS